MISFEARRRDLDNWSGGYSRKFRREFERAVDDIKREWEYEMRRQMQTEGDGRWPELEPEYAARKNRNPFSAGKPMLERFGHMFEGYIGGIQADINRSTISIEMPFPGIVGDDDRLNVRARSHQGVIGLPEGSMGARPFDTDRFEEIARDRFDEAMRRATNG